MSPEEHPEGEQPAEDPAADLPRRSFLYRFTAGVVGAIGGLVPVAAGLFVTADPLRRAAGGKSAPFSHVTKLAALPADGRPHLFAVVAKEKRDAWNVYRDVPLGSIYLTRSDETEGAPPRISALHSICPHLGCFVNQQGEGFYCPCHESQFLADGSRGERCEARRGMDPLEVRLEGDDVLVQFLNFKTDTEDRIRL